MLGRPSTIACRPLTNLVAARYKSAKCGQVEKTKSPPAEKTKCPQIDRSKCPPIDPTKCPQLEKPCCLRLERDICLKDPCDDLRRVKLDILCKVALITGGGSGIGYAAAYELLSNGAKSVVIAHPNKKKGKKAAECLCAQFGMHKAIYHQCDIRDGKQFEDIFLCMRNRCQNADILLNNAGVLDDKNWEYSLNTNVVGTIRGMLLAFRYMKGGVVINTCATAGLSPWPNCPIFAAGKHAVVTASRCFGHEFHYNQTKLRIMGLCPSFTNTSIWEKGLARHLENDWGKATLESLSKIRMQSASLVARAIIHLIKYGNTGTIYVCDQGVLHRAVFPSEEELLQPEEFCENY